MSVPYMHNVYSPLVAQHISTQLTIKIIITLTSIRTVLLTKATSAFEKHQNPSTQLKPLMQKTTQNRCLGNTPFYCNQTSFKFFLTFFTLLLYSSFIKKMHSFHIYMYSIHTPTLDNTPFYCNQTSFKFLFLSFFHTSFVFQFYKKNCTPFHIYSIHTPTFFTY